MRGTWLGIGGIGGLALALGLGLGLRPGSDPEAAAPDVVRHSPQAQASGPALARLGRQALSVEELQALLAGLPADGRARLKDDRPALEGWIRTRLAEKALLQQAVDQGWDERPEIQRLTREASERIILRSYLESVSQVPADYPAEAELRAAYEAGKDNWLVAPLLRVRQIFIAVDAQRNEQQARQRIQELARQAQAPKADFAALARQHSEDRGSAERGGDSGLQPLQQFLPGLRPLLEQLRPGQLSEPLRSEAGYHLVLLEERQPARQVAFDEVRESLRETLRGQRQQQVARAYLEGMLERDTLSIDGARLGQALEGGG